MRTLIIGVIIWFIGLPLTITISYILRSMGSVYALGMPEAIWFSMHTMVFVLSIYFLFSSFKQLHICRKVFAYVVILFMYGVYYVGLTWFYVISSGIDSV
ncbi:hypothetical protein [Pseudoalteromonas sp. TB64]|uniref:hypothetical protein n=1 Tax=Pseudoalteromonas sp. TB64 TaxID=1938600 RepID=UPI0004637B33|nr:hypothetical protein [Pseudoalteromonas sp. TB64]